LLCKVYFRIFCALKTFGNAQEEWTLISSMIKSFDEKFWGETAELKATASYINLPKREKSMSNIVRMCIQPMLCLLKQEKIEIRKGASDEKEHRL
jgi:hypothetical protein